MSVRISVFSSKELQGVILAMKGLPRELSKQLRAATKGVVQPMWQEAVLSYAKTPLEVAVLGVTARVSISNQNITLRSGDIGKALSGGGKPPDLVAGAEFGAKSDHQFKARNKKGYVVFQAAADVIPRIASLWVQTIVRTLYEQFEAGAK